MNTGNQIEQSISTLLTAVAVGSLTVMAAGAVRGWRSKQVRVRRGRPSRFCSLCAFGVALATLPVARATQRLPFSRRIESVRPPWSESSGSSRPPHSLARAECPHASSPMFTLPKHPRLFPRAGQPAADAKQRTPRRGLHPATARCCPRSRDRRWIVSSGDTLWSIAAAVLATDDERSIARYWPRIHRVNRDVIGANPDVIHPGQVLTLPNRADD